MSEWLLLAGAVVIGWFVGGLFTIALWLQLRWPRFTTKFIFNEQASRRGKLRVFARWCRSRYDWRDVAVICVRNAVAGGVLAAGLVVFGIGLLEVIR